MSPLFNMAGSFVVTIPVILNLQVFYASYMHNYYMMIMMVHMQSDWISPKHLILFHTNDHDYCINKAGMVFVNRLSYGSNLFSSTVIIVTVIRMLAIVENSVISAWSATR